MKVPSRKAITEIDQLKSEVEVNSQVLAFGFDRAGFDYAGNFSDVKNGTEYSYIGFDTHVDLNKYDVCIIPSGIFETHRRRSSMMDSYDECSFEHDRLLEFERMVKNFLNNKKVLIFLMSGIRKEIAGLNYSRIDVSHTDLAKKMLLGFFSNSNHATEVPYLKHNKNEFQKFTEQYGVGKTKIHSFGEIEHTPLVTTSSGALYGVEVLDKRLYFLPYHTTKKDVQSLMQLVLLTSESVSNYIQNHTANVPDWVKSYTFTNEGKIKDKVEQLKAALEAERDKQIEFDKYKSILCNQSGPLAVEVVSILKNYFGLSVNDKDEKLEDFSIINDENVVICSGEIKGVAGDCKRQYLSQMNANRDIKGCLPGTKALLIINDNMKLKTVSDKFLTTIPNDCLMYTAVENLNVLRTIDLINIMALVENKSIADRKIFFNELLAGEHGWIKCDGTKVEIVKSK